MRRFILPILLVATIISLIFFIESNPKKLSHEYLDKDMLFANIDNKKIYTKLINIDEEPQLLILTQGQEDTNIKVYDFNKSSYILNKSLGYFSTEDFFRIRISDSSTPIINLINSNTVITIPTYSIDSISNASINKPYKDIYPTSYYNFFIYEESPNVLKSNSKELNMQFITSPQKDNNFLLDINNIVSVDTLNNPTIYYNKLSRDGLNLYSYPLSTAYNLSPLQKETLLHENIYYSYELFGTRYSKDILSISKEENDMYNLRTFSSTRTSSLNIQSSKSPIAAGYNLYDETKVFYSTYGHNYGNILSYDTLNNKHEILCSNLPYIEFIDVCPSLGNPNKYLMLFRTNENGDTRYHLYNSLDPFEKDITDLILED